MVYFFLQFDVPLALWSSCSVYIEFRFLRTEMLGASGKLYAQFIISQDINGP